MKVKEKIYSVKNMNPSLQNVWSFYLSDFFAFLLLQITMMTITAIMVTVENIKVNAIAAMSPSDKELSLVLLRLSAGSRAGEKRANK